MAYVTCTCTSLGHRRGTNWARQYAGYGGYQSLRALCLRCRATALTRTEERGFWKGFDFGLPSWPIPGQVAGSEAWVEPYFCHGSAAAVSSAPRSVVGGPSFEHRSKRRFAERSATA